MPLLECRGISKSFGAVKALQGVDLSVEAGEIRSILGGNGSGKSTFAKILGGSVRADAGEARFCDAPLDIASPIDSKRRGIIVTSQELSLLSNLDVEENVMFCDIPKRFVFVDRKRLRRLALGTLERFGMADLAERRVSGLPPNKLYLLEFAKALVQNPKLLVIDEITSALYREDVELLKGILFDLKKQGCGILFISHRLNEIFDICDTVTVLRNGELVDTCPVAGMNEDRLLTMMSGQDVLKAGKKAVGGGTGAGEGNRVSVRGLRLAEFPDHIDIDVGKGEIVGVAGLQGNGQSDLVRALFAMDGAYGLQLDGADRRLASPRAAAYAGFAFVSGDREREGTFAIRSLLENAGAVTDLVLGRMNGDKEQALREFGVAMRTPLQPIRTLSGGNQQKVVLARWTTAKPILLLADDPTKGIDVNARREVHRFIRELAERGASVLFVSSDSEELVDLTRVYGNSRVIIMYRGKIVHTLRGDDITAENIAYHEVPRRAAT